MSEKRRHWRVERWSVWRRRTTIPRRKGQPVRDVRTVCEHDAAHEWAPDVDPETAAALELILDGARGPAVEELGARIRDDERGMVYEATISGRDGRVWLTSLTIMVTDPERQRIDKDELHRVPAQWIADQVALQLAADRARERMPSAATDDGEPILRIATPSPARRARGERPSDEELIAHVRAGHGRRWIATEYQVASSTVDNWLGPLRRAGLIAHGKPGRPRKASSGDAAAPDSDTSTQRRVRGATSRRGAKPHQPARKEGNRGETNQ